MPEVKFTNYNPPIEGSRADAVYAAVAVADPIVATELKIGIGANVPLRRQTEIVSALKFLAAGLRSRNLLEDGGFKGANLITAVNIDSITFNNRRTASSAVNVSLTDTDVFISMGQVATSYPYVVPLDTAIEVLTEVLIENLKDQQAA